MPAVAVPLQPPERSIWVKEGIQEQQHERRQTQNSVGPLSFSASTASSTSVSTASSSPLTLAHPQTAAHWLVWAAPVILVSSLLVAVFKSSSNSKKAKATQNSDHKSEFGDNDTKKSRTPSSPSPSLPSLRSLSASPFATSFPATFVPTSTTSPILEKYKSRGLPVDIHDLLAGASTHTFPFLSTHTPSFNTTYNNSVFPAPTTPPFLQKRLRRVYHLQNPAMDDEMTAASSFAGGDNGNASPQDQPFVSSSSPHPPPLPLSTSTFAFERPGLDNLSESDGPTPSTEDTMDGVSISFIHQPNPDYLGDSTSSVTMSATSVSTDAVAELPTEDEVSLTPFVGEMIAGTHHTQVYGGGVCLACLAAVNGGTIRPEDGPMYGENVPLEDRRQPLK